jgi:hypothetical protein
VVLASLVLPLHLHQLAMHTTYVNRWHSAYGPQGLQVIGVHTPEFGFERTPLTPSPPMCSRGLRPLQATGVTDCRSIVRAMNMCCPRYVVRLGMTGGRA